MAKILLAENDLGLKALYSQVLKKDGHTVTVAKTAYEVFAHLKNEQNFDCIIANCALPKQPSVDLELLTLKINYVSQGAPILLFSSSAKKVPELPNVEFRQLPIPLKIFRALIDSMAKRPRVSMVQATSQMACAAHG